MKKLLVIIATALFTTFVSGQKSIDALFEKYAGKEGFTTVTINGNLLKLAADLDDDKGESSLPRNIATLRILAQENDDMKVDNFYDAVIKDLDLSKYEEFISVNDSDEDVKMLVRTEGKVFKEFLLIVGGKESNAIIQILGSMTYDEVKKFAEDSKKNNIVINK